MRYIFFKEGKSNFFERLPELFSELHVKHSKFFLSYFWKKDDWPKAYAGPNLPTLPILMGNTQHEKMLLKYSV